MVLPPRRHRRPRLRPAAGDRVLGPHQPAGLGALRQRLPGRRRQRLAAGPLLRAGEPARRLRPAVPGGAGTARPGLPGRSRRARAGGAAPGLIRIYEPPPAAPPAAPVTASVAALMTAMNSRWSARTAAVIPGGACAGTPASNGGLGAYCAESWAVWHSVRPA